jgi:hypothetical protein
VHELDRRRDVVHVAPRARGGHCASHTDDTRVSASPKPVESFRNLVALYAVWRLTTMTIRETMVFEKIDVKRRFFRP